MSDGIDFDPLYVEGFQKPVSTFLGQDHLQ